MLKIRKNKNRIKSLPDQLISSNMASIIKSLPVINITDYESLSDDEKRLLDKLINTNTFNQDEIDKLIDHYNIIKGEILIGNNNPDLLKDLKLTVIKLMNYGILKMSDINKLLEYLFLLN